MKPSQRYRELVTQAGLVEDSAQALAAERLDGLHARLHEPAENSWWKDLFSRGRKPDPIRGIYFWGGVGRGKTLLMDLFYQTLPVELARRQHFHSFMNRIHAELGKLRNTPEPLARVAAGIAAESRVLCLDEFVIIDIGDAMIMAGLLRALFDRGVVLVTTSNAAPDDLYRDGLQRARFLPAIELLKNSCEVFNLDSGQDYRLRFLQQTDLYRVPHDARAEQGLQAYLDAHTVALADDAGELRINDRVLVPRCYAEDTVWFDFAELCESARSQNDYLELARRFSTLILSGIRRMSRDDDDVARRFVLLIDVLYDHRVKLICTAAAQPDELYTGKRLRFEFERTASRLIEMQSTEYLGEAHASH